MYEPFAEAFERHAEDSPHNAYYDRPAMLELLGDPPGSACWMLGADPGSTPRP